MLSRTPWYEERHCTRCSATILWRCSVRRALHISSTTYMCIGSHSCVASCQVRERPACLPGKLRPLPEGFQPRRRHAHAPHAVQAARHEPRLGDLARDCAVLLVELNLGHPLLDLGQPCVLRSALRRRPRMRVCETTLMPSAFVAAVHAILIFRHVEPAYHRAHCLCDHSRDCAVHIPLQLIVRSSTYSVNRSRGHLLIRHSQGQMNNM